MIIFNPYFVSAPPGLSPNDFPGLTRWYKTDTLLGQGYALNDPITSWPDSSVTGDNATNAGNQPLFQPAYFGSLPAVKNGLMGLTGFTLTDFTITFVGQVTSDSVVLGHSTLNTQVRIDRSGNNELSFFPDSAPECESNNFTQPAANTRMMTWRRTTAAITYRENKTAIAAAAGTNSHILTIDRIGSNPFTGFFIGFYAEITVWNTVLSDANLDNLYDNYFKPRWSLP
jgi:hypothetical protein